MTNNQEDIELDYQTLAYLRHRLAGRLINIRGASEFIMGGVDIRKWAEIINRDSEAITKILDECMEKAR